MKLDRNIKGNDRRGKYALLKMRELKNFTDPADPFQEIAKPIADAIETLHRAGIIDYGNASDTEFFVIRLKDAFAIDALKAYAVAAYPHDREYAADINEMASRSGPLSPHCKMPD